VQVFGHMQVKCCITCVTYEPGKRCKIPELSIIPSMLCVMLTLGEIAEMFY